MRTSSKLSQSIPTLSSLGTGAPNLHFPFPISPQKHLSLVGLSKFLTREMNQSNETVKILHNNKGREMNSLDPLRELTSFPRKGCISWQQHKTYLCSKASVHGWCIISQGHTFVSPRHTTEATDSFPAWSFHRYLDIHPSCAAYLRDPSWCPSLEDP